MQVEMLDIEEAITPVEASILQELVSKVAKEGDVFVEAGSWKGHSASIISRVLRDKGGHLYCVDHWKGNEGTGNVREAQNEDIYEIFEYNLKSLGLWDYITPLKMDSLTASKDFKDKSIDFLFIDADHRYEPFTMDLHAWSPKIKKGGVICGHDCEQFYSKLSERQKDIVNNGVISNIDFISETNFKGHPGIIKGLYDCLGDDYAIIENTSIWAVTIN
jgi:predicted O-methyltransferase YrrM